MPRDPNRYRVRSIPFFYTRPTRSLPMATATAVFAVLPGLLFGQAPESEVDRAAQSITAGRIAEHIGFLASDDLGGRDTPSLGLELAAAYLAEHHESYGLQPAGEGGTYLQRFPYQPPPPVPNGLTDPPNVVAMLPGSDPVLRDEFIVFSAHFDHVGIGREIAGDSIYNGADDNGSGTSVLLEVARALASLPESERPRRSVIFAHVSGEEKGLLGSGWWVANPTVPIENVVANLNVDMVSGDTHPDTVAVLGQDFSSLGPVIREIGRSHPELRLATVGDMWPGENLFFRSDQYNFMRKEIPALFLFAGFHDCYHRPCDEIGFINPDKAARVARLLVYTVLAVGNADDPPGWDPEGLAQVRQMISGG